MSWNALTRQADDEERVFVTLTVADQLCGVPVLGVRDILGEQRSRAFRSRRPRSPAASICAAASSLRSICGSACVCRRHRGQPRMSVVAEQGGELYALLVDQVSEVMSLKASAFERNPPTLPPPGRSSAAASIGWTAGCWWCSTWASCSR